MRMQLHSQRSNFFELNGRRFGTASTFFNYIEGIWAYAPVARSMGPPTQLICPSAIRRSHAARARCGCCRT